jgi:hypothetical protein
MVNGVYQAGDCIMFDVIKVNIVAQDIAYAVQRWSFSLLYIAIDSHHQMMPGDHVNGDYAKGRLAFADSCICSQTVALQPFVKSNIMFEVVAGRFPGVVPISPT